MFYIFWVQLMKNGRKNKSVAYIFFIQRRTRSPTPSTKWYLSARRAATLTFFMRSADIFYLPVYPLYLTLFIIKGEMWLKSKVGNFLVHWDFTFLVFIKESVVSKPGNFCHLATARKAVCNVLSLRLSQRLSLTLKCPNQRAASVTTPNSAWKQYTLVS